MARLILPAITHTPHNGRPSAARADDLAAISETVTSSVLRVKPLEGGQ